MKLSDWVVIIVDDGFDDQRVLEHIFKHYGATVHVARNGDECGAFLTTIMPIVIVTDLAMPERDGWQTLVAVRSNVRTAHIPVVAVTAYHADGLDRKALAAGFDAYFPKPLHPEHFIEALERIVN
ncbi:MAG: response regulator [Chloroflexota bacterium]|nr:response regulator [Chloroflexota bacterium]